MSRFHALTVAEVRRETREAVSLLFDVPDDLKPQFDYRPGQHLTLRLEIDGEEVVRNYSICAAPQDGELRVAIKQQPHGRFSGHALNRLRPGDVVEVMPPTGNFTAEFSPGQSRHYLAFASGSGITPILSLVKTALIVEPQSQVTLVYGNRSTANVIFREQLEDLKNLYMGRFNLVPVMSREKTDIDLFHGRIGADKVKALLQYWIDPRSVDEVFVCGPEAMITEVIATLEGTGFDRARIHYELFTPPGEVRQRQAERQSDPNADHGRSEVTVIADGQELMFELPRNTESILDAGLQAGADLPFSCKGGICSTCRARVLQGEVEMDVNYALEDYEVEGGYVLTCQSFPVSDKVVLSYDE